MSRIGGTEKVANGKYYVIGDDGGGRWTDDKGDATLMGGGDEKGTPFDWQNLAYTAGGGALGYMLSKWLMGDDEDKNGKKKDGSLLRSIVPWLAAAAGAYGGHVLSSPGAGAKGEKGEYAFRAAGDGKVEIPDKPMKGTVPHGVGWGLNAAGAPLAARGAARAYATRIERYKNRASAAQGRLDEALDKIKSLRRSGDSPKKIMAEIAEAHVHRAARDAIEEKLESIGRSRSLHPYVSGTFNAGGREIPGIFGGRLLNSWKGSLGLAGLMEALGLGAHWLGSRMNTNYQNYMKGRSAAGF